jgi:type II secretory pathway pseudopilin PulG
MKQRGSVLLEVLLATAVFSFAGIVVLGVVDGAVADGARAARRSLAMDVARSQLARMEAGISDDAQDDRAVPGLRVESRMEPSDFPGLALAVVEVYDEQSDGRTDEATNDPPRLAVLRQLLRGDGGGGTERPEVSR